MIFPKLSRHAFLTASVIIVSLVVHETKAAPSSFSGASAGGTGALAGTDQYGQAVAMSGVPVYPSSSGGSGYGQSTSLLSRSGGGSSPSQRSQSVLVGSSNGDTTVVQQTGDQPAKVYKISG